MNYDMMNNNRLSLTGTISSPVTFTHEVLGESFFETTIEVKRLSGMTDVIPLTVSDRLMCDAPLAEGEEVTVEGQFRSHNKTVGEKSKLLLTAFARDVIRPALVGVDPNSLEVCGYICKPPIYRVTPFNREICDVLLAVNRAYNKSDYIPCILWGRSARYAKELGVGFRATSAPMISKSGDLAAILTNLERNDVLFIDEIHRLNPAIEEVLYSAMEDFQLDLIIGEGPSARSVRIDLQPFTLVGATTRSGMLSTPLRERFGIPLRLDFYSPEELEKIVTRGANLLGMPLSKEGAMEIAKRSRGTPRVAGRLLRRVRDFGAVAGAGEVDNKMADKALRRLDVDNYGLDAFDRRYLQCIVNNYGGGPVGADTLAAALSEERDTIEEVVEPFLLKLGFLQRTPRGRVISDLGCEYLGIAKLRKNMRFAQNDLFDDFGDKN